MLIYKNTTKEFINDCRNNVISQLIYDNFLKNESILPQYSEMTAFQNSLPKVQSLIEIADLNDNMIAVEYSLPYNNKSRIDVLLFGKDDNNISNIVLIELKQWSKVDIIVDESNMVVTYTGGGLKEVPHPSQQVMGYENHLKSFVVEFELPPDLNLYSCSYCHNYKRNDDTGLFDKKYHKLIKYYPVFTIDDTRKLANIIREKLSSGDGFHVFNRFIKSKILPSKKLLNNAHKIIKNEAVFSLIDNQITARNKIWDKVKAANKNKEQSVLIIHGGPGTGKTLIAVNILAEAALRKLNVFFACKSKSLLEGLKKFIGSEKDYDPRVLFSNLYRFVPNQVKENEIDLLLVDEAHRIENKATFMFMGATHKSDMPQIEQLIRCAKTSVFFIDVNQNVRSQETCSPEKIRLAAKKFNKNIYEVTLESQFRCMGSDKYMDWIESLLGYNQNKKNIYKKDDFDFKIYSSPTNLYVDLFELNKSDGISARLSAGFCWPWSNTLDDNGQLFKDVKIGNFEMPWETHMKISRPPSGYVRWYEWAYKPEGIKQIGCIYTAQGFEFDYIGVIVGPDLVYDDVTDSLVTNIKATEDPTLKRKPDEFDKYVRNIYRVLFSRGMKGCYVYFCDKKTENYFRSRMSS